MMTNEQREAAARELCRLRGVDPEEQGYEGPFGLSRLIKQWQVYAEHILAHEQMQAAIAMGHMLPPGKPCLPTEEQRAAAEGCRKRLALKAVPVWTHVRPDGRTTTHVGDTYTPDEPGEISSPVILGTPDVAGDTYQPTASGMREQRQEDDGAPD